MGPTKIEPNFRKKKVSKLELERKKVFHNKWSPKLIFLKVQFWQFLKPWRYVNSQNTAISFDYIQLIFEQKP